MYFHFMKRIFFHISSDFFIRTFLFLSRKCNGTRWCRFLFFQFETRKTYSFVELRLRLLLKKRKEKRWRKVKQFSDNSGIMATFEAKTTWQRHIMRNKGRKKTRNATLLILKGFCFISFAFSLLLRKCMGVHMFFFLIYLCRFCCAI